MTSGIAPLVVSAGLVESFFISKQAQVAGFCRCCTYEMREQVLKGSPKSLIIFVIQRQKITIKKETPMGNDFTSQTAVKQLTFGLKLIDKPKPVSESRIKGTARTKFLTHQLPHLVLLPIDV